jgi:hypothetical protein
MVNLPDEILNRLRPLQQALADLVSKHDGMQNNHPVRRDLARTIQLLEAEIACRVGEATAG